ncbi:MAG: SDR family oxidoreductase [Candidatus Helarchaeota archaeon]|nr:SDR family oxidoreductase [Candidatus Helarchaeota archaeon]
MKLKDKVGIVTAAAGAGIGQAIAKKFAQEGAYVVLTDYHEKRTMKIADAMKSEYGEDRIIGIKCDVSNRVEVENMAKQALDKFGRIDILVNNAGREILNPVEKVTDEEWNIVVGVNLKGMFYCAKAVIPSMIKQKYGRLINISSIAAWVGSPMGECSYAAAKAGMIGFAKSLAREMGPYNITVNSITPGVIPNPFLEKIYPPGALDKIAKRAALGRGGKPEEVANVAAFLASEEASYVTGETIIISGGRYVR